MYTRRTILTVDLDSTLCDTGHRQATITRDGTMDWDAYSLACSDDVLIQPTETMIRVFKDAGHEIHYVSGRTIAALDKTSEWLDRHNLPVDGLWLDDTPGGDHFAYYGGHAAYKVARVKQVEIRTGGKVIMHIDDWAEVKVALEDAGIPCLCVRTPQEVAELVKRDEAAGSLG